MQKSGYNLEVLCTNVGIVHINSLKLNDLVLLLANIVRDEWLAAVVDEIILFGSAVTDGCTEDSDLDLCFLTSAGDEEFNKKLSFFKVDLYRKGFESPTDIFFYRDRVHLLKCSQESGYSLEQDIIEYGVTVYRRENI